MYVCPVSGGGTYGAPGAHAPPPPKKKITPKYAICREQ